MTNASPEARAGLWAALSAYLMWGLLPLYLKAVAVMPAFELLGWRIFFTIPVAAAGVWLLREQAGFAALLARPAALAPLLLSATLIGINWGVYVWAVHEGRVLEASVGYFLNPIVNVALGVVFLRERLGRLQAVAVCLAGLGVGVQAWGLGGLPWVTLVLAFSFAFYALVRKRTQAGPALGLLVETSLLAPVALLGLLWLDHGRGLTMPNLPLGMQLLVGASGVLTAMPLVLFAFGARRLAMATLGLLQYVAPTMQFALGLAYGERFTPAHGLSFMLIWGGLALFTASMVRARSRPLAARPQAPETP